MSDSGRKDRGEPPHLKLVTSAGVQTASAPTGAEPEQVPLLSPGEPCADLPDPSAASPASSDEGAPLQPVTAEAVRMIEAVLFASPTSLYEKQIAEQVPQGLDVAGCLAALESQYEGRGIELVRVAGRWQFRTAADLRHLLERNVEEKRKLSRAALETLAIIAYHQPVTRAEIEEVRGVSTSAGTIDILLDTGWIRMRGRRRAPGRPVTYGTTDAFLEHFSLDTVRDLPGLNELKGAGLLTSRLPADFEVPEPTDIAALMPDELPLEDEDEEAEARIEDEAIEDEAIEDEGIEHEGSEHEETGDAPEADASDADGVADEPEGPDDSGIPGERTRD